MHILNPKQDFFDKVEDILINMCRKREVIILGDLCLRTGLILISETYNLKILNGPL